MRMTAAQFREQSAPAKRNKFGAVKTTVDGIVFDSKREAAYYGELKIREKAGEVYEVELQKSYALTINGFVIGTYRADFAFWDGLAKRNRIIDVKGMDTPVSRIKRKMVKAIYGIDVEIAK